MMWLNLQPDTRDTTFITEPQADKNRYDQKSVWDSHLYILVCIYPHIACLSMTLGHLLVPFLWCCAITFTCSVWKPAQFLTFPIFPGEVEEISQIRFQLATIPVWVVLPWGSVDRHLTLIPQLLEHSVPWDQDAASSKLHRLNHILLQKDVNSKQSNCD